MKFTLRSLRGSLVIVATLVLASVALDAFSADAVPPTFTDVAYGPHERNKLDFWKASADKPSPVIVQIHGGGFYEGGKEGFRGHKDDIARSIEKGVSLASINYRFVESAPLKDILRDAARAIQFIRSKATEWNVDRTRIAAFGESAGAGCSLWLAFHDDLADPASPDPVLRESSRLTVAGGLFPQATYDFAKWPEILGVPHYVWYVSMWHISPTYYHCSPIGAYSEAGFKMRADLDLLTLISHDDPPVYLMSRHQGTELTYANLMVFASMWLAQKFAGKQFPGDAWPNFDILHHPNHAHALQAACTTAGLPCTAIYRETPSEQDMGVVNFLLKRLVP